MTTLIASWQAPMVFKYLSDLGVSFITNEVQQHVAQAQVRKLSTILARVVKGSKTTAERQAEVAAIRAELEDLEQQLQSYENIKEGKIEVPDLSQLKILPYVMVAKRIALGMSQRDLARKLGIKEQQIQRYEAENYRSASWHRLLDVINALQPEDSEENNP